MTRRLNAGSRALHRQLRLPQTLAERSRSDPMTAQAKCADVVEIAFAAALAHRQNMVGIPQAFTGTGAKPPVLQQLLAAASARVPESPGSRNGIDGARGTDTFVSQEDLLPQITRLRSQLPLVNTELRTEGEASARDL